MLRAHLNVASNYPVDANPTFRTWNAPTGMYQRLGRAIPMATDYSGSTFGVPQTYFDAWRQSQCS